jgi:hypothetical protein
MENYWLLALTMVLLSLWKVYIGSALAAFIGFSYGEMLLFNFIPAMVSALKAWYLGGWFFEHFLSNTPKGFNSRLRKMVRFWRRHGNWGGAILAPVLLGIPTYVVIANRFRTSFKAVMLSLVVTTWLWCSIMYFTVEFWTFSSWLGLDQYMTQ